VTPDSEAYLRKARESLASAEAELSGARFNSAASRAYYSAFQASVAMLIENGIKPRGDSWEHRFVMSEFSGKLVRRKKLIAPRFRGVLDSLFEARLFADYQAPSVPRRTARRSVREGRKLVGEIAAVLEQ
jgi:uncharacterized protein (UPF0332 family)